MPDAEQKFAAKAPSFCSDRQAARDTGTEPEAELSHPTQRPQQRLGGSPPGDNHGAVWIRRHRFLVGTITLLVSGFLVATALLFVWPATNAPQRVNAIVVLGGSGPRWQKGLALAREGYARILVLSDHPEAPCPRSWRNVRVICINPSPASTRGEAREVSRMAAQSHWNRLLVVTSIPQTTRARFRFDRCYHGAILFDPVIPGGMGEWLYNLAYEWAALAKALVLQRGC